LQGSSLFEAQLQGANLADAKLQGADLTRAQLQGANLTAAQLQGADLTRAQLQGANLTAAQLQGANLFGAGLWNIVANENTQLGLVDLREANFNEMPAGDLLARLPDTTPEDAKQRLRESLGAKVGGEKLPQIVNTTVGKILINNMDDAAWQGLDRMAQLTTQPAEIDPALAKLLADTVAPTAPSVAENVAGRVLRPQKGDEQRPLIKLLGCRLQAQVDANRVTLHVDTIEALHQAAGPCESSAYLALPID
jgi:hypothetical protein